jgi:hypothetical protein
MTDADYEVVVKTSLQRFRELYRKREDIDVELAKLRQFLYAALNMIPDQEKIKWERHINAAVNKATAHVVSLAGAIRKIYEEHPNRGWAVGGIRELLIEAGFDFSSYKSNPLSSISTTLRRMVETGELQTKTDAEGTTVYFPLRKPPSKQRRGHRFYM